ncbi:MAG: ATP synthase F1 subunit delta [Defluviitaleaceae bacterium]|nr:ATP synthase F1 subunit delta [Defluviitaleaceae bacterium]
MAELSVRYATALFELSRDGGTLGECLKQAVVVRDALSAKECRSIIEHPQISGAEKRVFLDNVFAEGLNGHLNNFLSLLISKNRESIMTSALTTFIDMGNRVSGKTDAEVVSAVALDEGQIAVLKAKLEKKLGKTVDITTQVDPSLIGGLYVYADGHYMDHSIKKQLKDVRSNLKHGEWLDGPQA